MVFPFTQELCKNKELPRNTLKTHHPSQVQKGLLQQARWRMAPLPSHILTLQIALFQGNSYAALCIPPLSSTG